MILFGQVKNRFLTQNIMTYYILFKIILQKFFKFLNFQPRCSYRMYSHKKKNSQRGQQNQIYRKEGKRKEREKEKRIETRTKKIVNKNSFLSKFWLMRMPQKTKMKLNQV